MVWKYKETVKAARNGDTVFKKVKFLFFSQNKDWEKKYLWGLLKFKPYYNSKIYSECMKDTISVINNIKIKE